ncbi:MAG: DNA polymerase IV [Armatimonadetes bacterium]|nr:DNA polymerase IV [Armatimonadota bacterium]
MANSERIILHVDMDAFYAAVEQRDRPELRGQPVIVGGTPEGRGVVSAASYEAREFGIHSAMPTAQAVRLCPDGVFLPVDFRKYRVASAAIMGILARYSDTIEQISIDEAFLDVTDRTSDFPEAKRVATRIKRDIRSEVRLTASVGVAPNKFLAKLASDHDKPDGLVVIRPHEAENFLAPLPVQRLWGIGPKTASRLEDAGLRTIADITKAPLGDLRRLLGAWADVARELACGVDERPVETSREAKSVSAEQTFARDLQDIADMRRALAALSEEVARRLEKEGVLARTVTIKVRFPDFRTITRQARLPDPTDQPSAIRHLAHELLASAEIGDQGVRLLGVKASSLEHGAGQLSLFDEKAQRRGDLERTLSYLRKRYGPDAVKWAREMGESTNG